MAATYLTNSAQQTKNLGKRLAQEILKSKQDKPARSAGGAFVLALQGDLGGGKTTFLQGFAQGLGIKEKILSPTFVIVKRFTITKIKNQKSKIKMTKQNSKITKFKNFYHVDCYRIQNPKEILALGFKDIITNPQNIVAIEWAEKIKGAFPKNCLAVRFDFVDKAKRKITLKNFQFSIPQFSNSSIFKHIS